MSSSGADQIRAELREAYDAGDFTQAEYLCEGEQLYLNEYLIKYVGVREEYEMNILDLNQKNIVAMLSKLRRVFFYGINYQLVCTRCTRIM